MAEEMALEFLMSEWSPGDEHTWFEEFDRLWEIHPFEMDDLLDDIHEVGMRTPIQLGADGRVWDGHHRIAAAHELGLSYVPVQYVGTIPEGF